MRSSAGFSTYKYVTLGCIPTGSGNDFVRGLNLERDPVKALHQILNPHCVLPIKIGCVISGEHQASFGVAAGVGFELAVCLRIPFSAERDSESDPCRKTRLSRNSTEIS